MGAPLGLAALRRRRARRILSPPARHKEPSPLRLPLASRRRPRAGGAALRDGDAPAGRADAGERQHLRGAVPAVRHARADCIRATSAATRTGWRRRLVEAQAQRVRNAGCITLTRDLAGMEAVGGPPVADSAPAIPPISLHAGVVTNMQDDARARAFFAAHGVPARSVGSAPLGRRIYLGPFATQGALDAGARPGAPRRVRRALSGEVLMRRASRPHAAVLAGGMAPAALRAADPALCLQALRGLRPGGLALSRRTSGATTSRSCAPT